MEPSITQPWSQISLSLTPRKTDLAVVPPCCCYFGGLRHFQRPSLGQRSVPNSSIEHRLSPIDHSKVVMEILPRPNWVNNPGHWGPRTIFRMSQADFSDTSVWNPTAVMYSKEGRSLGKGLCSRWRAGSSILGRQIFGWRSLVTSAEL